MEDMFPFIVKMEILGFPSLDDAKKFRELLHIAVEEMDREQAYTIFTSIKHEPE